MNTLEELANSLRLGKPKEVAYYVQMAIREDYKGADILNKGLLRGMDAVGKLFGEHIYYIPEVIAASQAMNAGLSILTPLLQDQGVRSAGKVVLGTVRGDLHDIGKNLVRILMESRGLEVIDLGTDVPAEQFVYVAQSERCQVIAMSALLTITMRTMEEVINELQLAGIRERFNVMIGGAPVSAEFCNRIGADAYTADAAAAAKAALELCGGVPTNA